MMHIKSLILISLLSGLIISCNRDDIEPKVYSFAGKAQKGPFITGTNLTLNELNSNLAQTGRTFTATISSDDGSFSLNNIELNSNLALLTANGFYFSEIYGELSGATLSLQAITDLTDRTSVNINVLTHITKARIEKLVADGSGFNDACEQAKSELLTFLGVTDPLDWDLENLDISGEDEQNGILLAFSIILQRYTMIWNERPLLTAELTQLLANLSSDFAPDGQITSTAIIDTLLYNISQLNLIDIRKNIEKRYSDLGQNVTIPDFEKYIAAFLEKHTDYLYTDFFYPDSASPEPVMAPDAKLPNILFPDDTLFKAGMPYVMAAIIPLNSSLKIVFTAEDSNHSYSIGGPNHGWELVNNYPEGFTLNSQRQNEIMTMLFYLDSAATATIDYFENNSENPTFTKKIRGIL